MKLNRKNKKGFTIVELVIVIGVIGILSAILIPTFANLTGKAQVTAKQADLAAVYAEYAADVADGYYGEDTTVADNKADKMYAQGEVCLALATNKYYTFDDGKWNATEKSSPALEAANKLHTLAVYNGYTVYKKA